MSNKFGWNEPIYYKCRDRSGRKILVRIIDFSHPRWDGKGKYNVDSWVLLKVKGRSKPLIAIMNDDRYLNGEYDSLDDVVKRLRELGYTNIRKSDSKKWGVW